MFNILLSVPLFLYLILRGECRDSCVAEDLPGTCRRLEECPSLLAEIKKAGYPMPSYLRRKLQSRHCGYEADEPVICCLPDTNKNQGDTSFAGNPSGNNDSLENNWGPIDKGPTNSNEIMKNDEINRKNSKEPPDVTGHRNLKLLPTSLCGVRDSDKITGGHRAQLFEIPWMALLSYDSGRANKLSCGGTLITKWYVLTAAHCVSFLGKKLKLASVILGEYDTRQDPDCIRVEGELTCAPNRRNISIASIIAHPGYTPQTLFDDIALIRLAEPADFNLMSMKPICLPVTAELQRESLIGKEGLVAGWGATEDGLQSAVLLLADLPILDNKDCSAAYNGTPPIYNSQICAGGVEDKDSCGGDSGGPLMYPGDVGVAGVRYVQRGIVSYGSRRCGINGFPGVYTRVAYYMDWILNNIRS